MKEGRVEWVVVEGRREDKVMFFLKKVINSTHHTAHLRLELHGDRSPPYTPHLGPRFARINGRRSELSLEL